MNDKIKVVSFPGNQAPKREPNPEVVAAIEDMLELAKSGELIGFMAVTSQAKGKVERWDYGDHWTYPTMGALHMSLFSLASGEPEEKL